MSTNKISQILLFSAPHWKFYGRVGRADEGAPRSVASHTCRIAPLKNLSLTEILRLTKHTATSSQLHIVDACSDRWTVHE
jgi:hypothetical protein